MKKEILFSAVFFVAASLYGLDVVSGAVKFRLPEKGGGISVLGEKGKTVRLFHTNLNYSDDVGRRYLKIEQTKSNKIEKLDALPGRTAYRVTYPVKDTDAMQFSTVYRFYDGVPGVTATEEVLAVKPVRIHSWNMTGAWRLTTLNPDGTGVSPFPKPPEQRAFSPRMKAIKKYLLAGDAKGRIYFYDRNFRTLEGGIFYSVFQKPLSRTEGTLLEPGQSFAFTRTAGIVTKEGDAERIELLRDRVICDGRTTPVLVTRLAENAGSSGPDWSSIPVAAVRSDVKDYRPLASNQWKGPSDLSFTLKAAYDEKNFHLFIDVTDETAVNRYSGKNMWIGDSVQIGIDPLTEKMNGSNHIDLLAAIAGVGPRLWCVTHSLRKYCGNLAESVSNRSHIRKGGFVYDLSLPWEFFSPFKCEGGTFAMSFSVIDQDLGSSYETWMGLTDGVFAGRDCTKYATFALEGIAGLSEGIAQNAVKIRFKREDLLALHDRVSKLAARLAGMCSELKKKRLEDDYLDSVVAMSEHFLAFERDDIDAEKVWKGGSVREVPVTDVIRSYIYNRFHFNLTYLEKLLGKLAKRAEDTLQGKRRPERFMLYPALERPVVADGGFKSGGKELLLYGPNTWVAGAAWKGRLDHIATMARTGFNLFNLFNASEPWRTDLMKLAEREGIYCSFGNMTSSTFTFDEAAWDKFWKVADSHPTHIRAKFGYATPNLVFQVGFPEQFGRTYEKTPEWEASFRKRLLDKFGSLAKINEELSTSFSSMGEIDFASALANPALKYESMQHRLDLHIPREMRHLDYKRRRFDNLPMSGHYSTHWNIAGLDPLLTLADFERVWSMFDIIGFDGGCSLGNSEFIINFASGCLDIDLARSFYPEKPIANNEDHVIPDGTYRHYTDEESYLAAALPFFLGQNAASMWLWMPRYHGDGEHAFTMANTYHASLRLAADLRIAPEEIASFRRTPSPPLRILHSVPSMTDRDSYVRSLYGVYAGCSFSGWAVRFLSERKVERGDFEGAKIVVMPDARRVSDSTFAALVKFVEKGGRVVVFGKDALLGNEYGRLRPGRQAVRDRLFRLENVISSRKYYSIIAEELARANIKPPVNVVSEDGKSSTFGVITRSGRTADGRETLLAVNVLGNSAEIIIPGRWRDALTGAEVSGKTALPVGGVHVLVRCD